MRTKARLKTMLSLCVFMGMAAPIALIGWYRWDSSQNRGFEFGYFGAFNRVQHALAAIPGVTAVRPTAMSRLRSSAFTSLPAPIGR
jgi:hypothetical protein